MTDPLPKPLYGLPCNGCGLCCILEQCPLSEAFFGQQPICPALEALPTGAYACGIVRAPQEYLDLQAGFAHHAPAAREAFAVMLGAGLGCDGVANDADRAARKGDDEVMKRRGRAARAAASPEAQALINFMCGPAA